MNAATCPCCGQPLDPADTVCPCCGRAVSPQAPADFSASPLPREHKSESNTTPETPPTSITFTEPASTASHTPHYDPVTPQEADGGLSTAQYFWTLFLFAIPVIGLVPMIYWSFGSTTSPARQRLARACLIKTGIFSVIAALIFSFVFACAMQIGGQLLSFIEDLFYGPDDYGYYGYYDYYDDYSGYYYSEPSGSSSNFNGLQA
jgi:hypothetical protein